MTCDEGRMSLGAYAIGTLDAGERPAVAAHLAGCSACRAELEGLAGLAPMLDMLTIDDVEAPGLHPDPELFDRLRSVVTAADQPVDRRRRRWLVAAAAGLIVLAGSAGIATSMVHRGSPPSYSASAGNVRMTVALHSQAQGTALAVTVAGLPEDEHCRLVAVGRDGATDLAGTWTATYSGTATVSGSTRITRSSLDQLVLYGTTGQRLVTVTV